MNRFDEISRDEVLEYYKEGDLRTNSPREVRCTACNLYYPVNQVHTCYGTASTPLDWRAPALQKEDLVNSPPHYRAGDIYETIKVIEAWSLGFNLGNTIKYISRAKNKGTQLEDLKKARWYLDREIASLAGKL